MEFSVIIQGHDQKYNLEHIIKAVFFGAQLFFHTQDKVNKVISSWDGNTAHTTLILDGKISEGEFVLQEDAYFLNRAHYIMARSFIRAVEKQKTLHLPWGILTGIRPAKIASKLLTDGYSIDQVRFIFREELLVSEEKTELMLTAAEKELEIRSLQIPNGCSLYVGIPFCPTRCAYCSFISKTYEDDTVPNAFLLQLEEEITCTAELIQRNGLIVDTIYFGGGTPTTLSSVQLNRILSQISREIDLSKIKEFTVEAGRPDTITEEKLMILKSFGVDRLSINPQTMHDKTLKLIGRNHTVKEFKEAYKLARKSGFSCINTDLIAGLPEETAEDFEKTLDEIIKLEPENITIHTLALKRASRLNQEHADVSTEKSVVSRILSAASQKLDKSGYHPYYLYRQKNILDNLENVGYAKPNFDSIYNVYMMEEMQTTLAVGGGGITKLVNRETGKISRIPNPKLAEEYLRQKQTILTKKIQIMT